MIPTETQESISLWADETFGPAGSNVRVAARANEEMAELLRALSVEENHPKAAEEMADVVIIFMRLATLIGADLLEEVNKKMQVNRQRNWQKDGSGHGYHKRSDPPARCDKCLDKQVVYNPDTDETYRCPECG